jgi:hypothetical protein
MKCYVHPEAEATGACTICGRATCSSCAVDVGGRLECRQCLAAGQSRTGVKDPNTAFLIELIGGFFGLLGLGYIYAGRSNDGALRLVLWMLYVAMAWMFTMILLAFLVGLVCIPLQLLIQVGVPIWSAVSLKEKLQPGVI